MERALLRAPRALSVAAAVAAAGLAPIGAGAASPEAAPTVTAAAASGASSHTVGAAALDWLGDELAATGGAMPGFGATIDWGLTADAILAFTAAGRGADPEPSAALDRLAANVDAYTTWNAAMPGSDVRLAGPTAKTLLALAANGRALIAGGVDLDAELRGLMVADGSQLGRFSDRVPNPAWNGANGFGQALAVLALQLDADGAPAEAVSFLVDQQCPSGGFRLDYGTTAACDDDADADADASALALSALLAVDRTPEVRAALGAGVDWLLDRQNADGAFDGTGPTAAPNANSAGTAAQVLRAAGYTAHADAAAAWIERCCVDPATGAIAYNADGLAGGFTAQTADQWRRSTAQAVLAFGLAPYGPAITPLVTSPPPATGAAPTTAAPATTAPPPTGAPTTTVPPTTVPPTVPTTVPTTVAPGALVPTDDGSTGGDRVLDSSLTRNGGDAGAVAGATLAATGTSAASTVAAGLGMVAAGAALLGARLVVRAMGRT